MFGKDGMITDEAVRYATGEVALNLDTPLAEGVSDLVKEVPAMRPFLMFPTTGMNMIDVAGKYNLSGLRSNGILTSWLILN